MLETKIYLVFAAHDSNRGWKICIMPSSCNCLDFVKLWREQLTINILTPSSTLVSMPLSPPNKTMLMPTLMCNLYVPVLFRILQWCNTGWRCNKKRCVTVTHPAVPGFVRCPPITCPLPPYGKLGLFLLLLWTKTIAYEDATRSRFLLYLAKAKSSLTTLFIRYFQVSTIAAVIECGIGVINSSPTQCHTELPGFTHFWC